MAHVTLPVPTVKQVRSWVLRVLVILIVVYLAYVVREIWLPLGLAFLIAMVLDPVVDRMERRGWNRTWASAFIFGSFLVIVVGLIVLSMPHLIAQGATLQDKFAKYFPDTSHKGLVSSFHKLKLPPWLANIGVQAYEGVLGGLQRSSNWLTDYGMRFVSNMIWVVIVPIVAFYTLRDFDIILGKSLVLVQARRREKVKNAVVEVTGIFAKYLRGLMIVSALNGLATAILLTVLGVPSSIILGIAAGLLYTVPYIGAMMTIVLTAAVAFVGGGAQLMLVALGASVLLHQIVFDQIITPRILGGQVGLHPILSIVALLSGNILLGIAGMILAVPVAACIQIAVVSLVPKLGEDVEPEQLAPIEQAQHDLDEGKPSVASTERHAAAKAAE